jgi:hypothetical protein
LLQKDGGLGEGGLKILYKASLLCDTETEQGVSEERGYKARYREKEGVWRVIGAL